MLTIELKGRPNVQRLSIKELEEGVEQISQVFSGASGHLLILRPLKQSLYVLVRQALQQLENGDLVPINHPCTISLELARNVSHVVVQTGHQDLHELITVLDKVAVTCHLTQRFFVKVHQARRHG